MLVIFNATAGRRRVRHLWSVLDVLVGHGVRLEVVETRHAGHARILARDAVRGAATLVVAAGGDGTIAEVASGLIGTGSASSRWAPPTCSPASCGCRSRPARSRPP